MPIIDIQRQLMEAGRIRIGQQVPTAKGGKRPASLETFRLTSPDKVRIEAAAKLYGGDVKQWDNNGRKEWEVVTTTDRLPVVVPPAAMAFTQWMELWSGGGCLRRCDTRIEQIKEQPCLCDPDRPECSPHTRLSLMLSDVKGIGLWRLDTQGFYAARELGAAVETISLYAERGVMLPATLRLEQRSSKHVDEGTKRFVVPVLDIESTPLELISGQLKQKEIKAALTPVPAIEAPPQSIAQQVEAAKAIESRKRTASMPSTGVKPRTAAEAKGPIANIPTQVSDRAEAIAAAQARLSPKDPYADVPPPESPSNEQIMKAVTEVAAVVKRDTEGKIKADLLQELVALLTKEGFEDKQSKLDWCTAAVGHPLENAGQLTIEELHELINTLHNQPVEEPDTKLQEINEHYAHVTRDEMLGDITEFLQRETRLESLTDLTEDEKDAIITALKTKDVDGSGTDK